LGTLELTAELGYTTFYMAFQIATMVATANPPVFVGSWADVAGNRAIFHMTRLWRIQGRYDGQSQ